MSHNIDPQRISEIIKDCAEKYIMPRHDMLEDHHINTKSSPNDLVTIADIETEKALERILEKEFAGSVVVGEESVSAGTKPIELLQNKEGTFWVVDPVDGTSNFVHGSPHFCVMMACIIDGVTAYSWIYDMLTDRMMVAEKGAGTEINGVRQSTARQKPLIDTIGLAGRRYYPKPLREDLDELSARVKSLSTLSCSGHEYLRIATGEADFNLCVRCRPWDHLAGSLAVQEAGGHVISWDGSAYTPQDDYFSLIVASNESLLTDLKENVVNNMIEKSGVS